MDCPELLKFSDQEKEKIKEFKKWSMSIALHRAEAFSKSLHDGWETFYNSLYPRQHMAMDYTILGQAAESFWEDILRVEAYHDFDYADRHKQAAYLFKWLSRMRPIRPAISHREELEKKLTAEVLQANALFALACAQSFLKCSDFSKEEKEYILYSSMYRDIHASEWSMIFYLLEKIHSKAS